MKDVSRETSPRQSPAPFLTFLKTRTPVASWIDPGDTPPARLKNVHLGLLPFLVLLRNPTPERPLVCIFPENSSEDLNRLFQLLLPFYADRVALLAGPILDPQEDRPGLSGDNVHPAEPVINRFCRGHLPILLTTDTLWRHLPLERSHAPSRHVTLREGISLDPGRLKTLLIRWGYHQTDRVSLPGSFAVRGGIVDIFPLERVRPVRLEFFGNRVDSARIFDPVSQRTVDSLPTGGTPLYPPFRLHSPHRTRQKTPLPHGLQTLSFAPAGPTATYHVTPRGPGSKPSVDLRCVAHGPFHGNRELWRDLNAQLKEKQIDNLFIFHHPDYAARLHDLPGVENFVPVPFPVPFSFSSSTLNLFCGSLEQVEDLPVPLAPASTAAPGLQPLERLEDFPWQGPVVHEDFGIGLYRGLSHVKAGKEVRECVCIEYAGGDRVHVPLERLSRVHPYVGSSSRAPELSNLRSSRWERLKEQTRRSAEKVVDEFIDLYAQRHRTRRTPFSPDSDLHGALKNSFPYEETPDQITAYEQIRKAMETPKPMDWLLCGDVGFGKTEIALRAAFKAAYDHHQVAVLAPTTILANQLFVTFRGRLEPLGVAVALLSRFTPAQQQRIVLEQLKQGTVDVIVGTHRLLSSDVNIPNLGLVIIDDEHRFGARHKERLKEMRTSVDVLSMSATPIPRTLTFSLLGIRDICTIRTPPRERLPVITRVLPASDKIIRKAVRFELARGGQVFFIHNDIATLEAVKSRLETLLTGVRIGIAHGRLPGRTLEAAMLAFLKREIDLLVCTSIIEAGIDLPNVNTIFIHNAHRFGLAQIYQMRGRVGRSNRQAYCYLFLPRDGTVTTAAHDRLKTLEFYSSLGSGYPIALKDLEVRGAGNLFGTEQSGHIGAVGFHLYCKIVEEAAAARLPRRPEPLPHRPLRVSFHGPALIPRTYVSHVSDRLYFYRLLAEAADRAAVNRVEQELSDRFGPLPGPCQNLLSVAALQAEGTNTGITSIVISPSGIRCTVDRSLSAAAVRTVIGKIRERLASRNMVPEISRTSTSGLEISLSTRGLHHALETAQYLFETTAPASNFGRQNGHTVT